VTGLQESIELFGLFYTLAFETQKALYLVRAM